MKSNNKFQIVLQVNNLINRAQKMVGGTYNQKINYNNKIKNQNNYNNQNNKKINKYNNQ